MFSLVLVHTSIPPLLFLHRCYQSLTKKQQQTIKNYHPTPTGPAFCWWCVALILGPDHRIIWHRIGWQVWDWCPVHIVMDTQLDFVCALQNLVYVRNYTSRKYCATDKNLLLSRNSMLTQIQQMSKRIVWIKKPPTLGG